MIMSDEKNDPEERTGLDAPVLGEDQPQTLNTDATKDEDEDEEDARAIDLPLEEGQFDSQP
jgi:hypothetical protein